MAGANRPDTDREFVAELRAATDQFLAAVDAWEAGYRKYYRLADPARKVSADLEEPEKVYAASRRRLSVLAPRARGLCFKYGLTDPWTGLLRTSLGQYAPQDRAESAISRTERQLSLIHIFIGRVHQFIAVGGPPRTDRGQGDGYLRIMDCLLYTSRCV